MKELVIKFALGMLALLALCSMLPTTTVPQTGDTNTMMVLAAVAICAAGLMAVMLVRQKQAEKQEREQTEEPKAEQAAKQESEQVEEQAAERESEPEAK